VIVLDSSALIALLQDEAGADVVADHLDGAIMSTANLAEVLSKAEEWGGDAAALLKEIARLPINMVALSVGTAVGAARLRPLTKPLGLSLGDRICIALAEEMQCDVLTADKRWRNASLKVKVRLIR
jgi:ribonuclease VapC